MTIDHNNENRNDDNDDCDDVDEIVSSELSTMIMTMTMKKKLKNVQYEVVVHPLVLLSVADHYHRVARGTRKRVIGILLGQTSGTGSSNNNNNKSGIVMDVTNSFALPFEEDLKNPVCFCCFLFYSLYIFVFCIFVLDLLLPRTIHSLSFDNLQSVLALLFAS
jgi:JAB1/Mov34/MPN/PAD-1 ubiquitin protease